MELVCIICPNSCRITVEDGVVSGAKCKRGDLFAIQEELEPMRTVTTTIFRGINSIGSNGEMIPVKSKKLIPLREVINVVKKIKKITLKGKPQLGDIIMDKELLGDLEFIVTGE